MDRDERFVSFGCAIVANVSGEIGIYGRTGLQKNNLFCLCAQHAAYSLTLAVVVQHRVHGFSRKNSVEKLSSSLVGRLGLRRHRKESFRRHKRTSAQKDPRSDRRTGGMPLLVEPDSLSGKLGSWSRT